MIRKILGLVLPVVAFMAGAGAVDYLNAPPADTAETAADAAHRAEQGADADGHGPVGDKAAENEAAGHKASEPAKSAGHAASATGHGAAGSTKAAPGGHSGKASGHDAPTAGDTAWFKFPQQFFVPVMRNGRLESTMVLSLSLEMPTALTETVYAHEIKLRDALLRQLLIHANTGGFDGNFTAEPQMRVLKADLGRTAQGVLPELGGILIGDIARQEAR